MIVKPFEAFKNFNTATCLTLNLATFKLPNDSQGTTHYPYFKLGSNAATLGEACPPNFDQIEKDQVVTFFIAKS